MQEGTAPTPERIWQVLTGFQMTAAFKAAVELDVFTQIANGNSSVAELAKGQGVRGGGSRNPDLVRYAVRYRVFEERR